MRRVAVALLLLLVACDDDEPKPCCDTPACGLARDAGFPDPPPACEVDGG